MAINGGLLLLNIVPIVGSIVAICGGMYFQWFILGLDYLDFPMSLRGIRREQKRAFAKHHRWHTLGLGAAVFLLILIPAIGAIFLTTAAAGAVLLHRRLSSLDAVSATPIQLG